MLKDPKNTKINHIFFIIWKLVFAYGIILRFRISNKEVRKFQLLETAMHLCLGNKSNLTVNLSMAFTQQIFSKWKSILDFIFSRNLEIFCWFSLWMFEWYMQEFNRGAESGIIYLAIIKVSRKSGINRLDIRSLEWILPGEQDC